MPWQLVGTAAANHNTVANFAFTCPTVQANDVAWVFQFQEHDTGMAVTPPTGFTASGRPTGENATSSPDTQYRSWTKVLDGSEGGTTLTFTHNSVYRAAILLILRPPGTPSFSVASASVTTSSAATNVVAAVTAINSNIAVVASEVDYHERDATYPGGTTKEVEAVGASGGGVSAGWREQASAGTTGTTTITLSGTTPIYSASSHICFSSTAGSPAYYPPQSRRTIPIPVLF